MIKKIYFLILVLSNIHLGFSQPINFEWVNQFGGSSVDIGQCVDDGPSGSVYSAGRFTGTCDFDPTAGINNLVSAGAEDIYVSKHDASGNVIWVAQFKGPNYDFVEDIEVDNSGYVYLVGYFSDSLDVDPGPGTFNLYAAPGSGWDGFLVKLDPSGNLIWAFDIGNNLGDMMRAVALEGDHVFTTGYFTSIVDFDPGPSTANLNSCGGPQCSPDVFVASYSTGGSYEWCTHFTSQDTIVGLVTESGYAIDVLNGKVLVGGTYSGAVDFDPGPGTLIDTATGNNTYYDTFIVELDSAGNLNWAKFFGGTANDNIEDLVIDNTGSIYATGHFQGTGDYDPGPGVLNLSTSLSSTALFVVKLNPMGNLVFAKQCGVNAFGYGIDVDANANVYFTGDFNSTVDFDAGLGTQTLSVTGPVGYTDVFVAKWDSASNFIWVKQFTSSGAFDTGQDIAVGSDMSVYTTGQFGGTNDFNPAAGVYNLISFGVYDAFIHKLNQNSLGITEINSNNALFVYPNPASEFINVKIPLDIEADLIIYNSIGQCLWNEKLIPGTEEKKINVSTFPSGPYYYSININGELYAGNFIVY